ncbi:TonB-dependent receptor [Roseateles oligotrophus]|uniref:TonB-dependent receptor n=1 Tax=Roseateles oligotrophus TaxID=1769250 RepID=A0ABT2YC91_9BURK|nr:TonB-dependent receptor [Roseateles oligotrophus]MCV2367655.1 TonB-dependent receptor [Roseateles oligotrophus]
MSQPVFKQKLLPSLISLMLGATAFHNASAADEAPQAAAASTAAASKNAELETVEIRGIRATLNKNIVEKRESSAIIDSISAEDVGKFPDKNVADSLQRVPGISVDRTWGEGRDIFVRGTDKNLNMTQLNGQSVSSAYWWKNDKQSRGFNYDVLPSEVIGSLDVYKSPMADLDEGSIGGLVNVKTRKPLSFKDQFTAQGSVEATYSKLPGKTDPQFAGLLNWKNEGKTFGVLLALSEQKRTLRRDGLENFLCSCSYVDVVDQKGAVTKAPYAPWGGGSAIFRQDRERTTATATLEFKPVREADIVLNYLNSDMKMNNSNQNYLFLGTGADDLAGTGKINVTDPKFISTSDGKQSLVGGTLQNGTAAFEPIYRESFIRSSVLDLDGTYSGNGWQLHGQVGSTKAEGGSDHDRNLPFLNAAGQGQAVLSLAKDQFEWKYLGLNPLDPKAMTLALASPMSGSSPRDWVRKMESKENYAQADLTYDLNGSFINDIKVGIKFRDAEVKNNRTIGTFDTTKATWVPISLADISSGPSPMLSQAAATAGSLTQYAWVDDSKVQKVFDMYAKGFVYKQYTPEYYKISEKITAAYAKADYVIDKFRGDFGVRFVRTQQTSEAYQGVAGTPGYAIGSVAHNYNNVLPNFNGVYQLRKDLYLRGAVSRAMARQNYSDLSATTEINGTGNGATAGNPLLKPILANQAEFGAEWYFADASLLSATVFTKQLDTFVYTTTKQEGNLQVKRPHNADNGAKINGLELQWQQPFGRTGFGSVVNYTYTDATAGSVDGKPALKVSGNSKNQLNASAFYEQNGISLRISYNYRDKSYGELTDGGQAVTSAYGQWDASAGWDITPKISLYASAVNLTNEVVKRNTTDGLPLDIYENGSRYTVGLRAKF